MDAPEPQCYRCSKPIAAGLVSQLYSRPVHVRCVAQEILLDAIEQRERAQLERRHARAARIQADEMFETVRGVQNTCPTCGEHLRIKGGVLFQGDSLVNAVCWRTDPGPVSKRLR